MALFSKKSAESDLPRRRRQSNEPRREEASQRQQNANYTFKRNRTLTGSASSHVTSISDPHGDLQSPRTQTHHLTMHRRKLGGVFAMTMLCTMFFGFLLYQFTATASVSAADQSLAIDGKVYQETIQKYLVQHPIERFRFALNEQRLTAFLQKQHSEVTSVASNGIGGLGASQFSVAVRKPIAGWVIGDKQYYVDATGVSFQKNYHTAPGVQIVDQSGVRQSGVDGGAVASGRFLTFVGRAIAYAETHDMIVEQAIIPPATTRQVELRIKAYDFPVKLSLDRPVGEQIEDMQRTIIYLRSESITPKYIDVRVSGKAFYR